MNLTLFHFIRPYWLVALLPWLIMLILLLKRKLQRGSWLNVCDEELLPYILQEQSVKPTRLPIISISLASLLTIFALAGPTWQRVPSPAFRNDSGLVIALDLSASMEASDIKPSRLVRARYKVADILKQRKDGQTALLVYAGDAFTVTPLTNDNATIASQLEALSPDIMPSAGSNTASAVEKAVELFKQAGLQQGQILLITDGINADETTAVIKKLSNYRLSVLAVGTEQGAPISLLDGGFLKDEAGSIVIPKLPIAALKNLAQAGQGVFAQISDTDSDIKAVLAAVDKAVQQSVDNSKNTLLLEKWDEKGVWLVLLVLPLAALSFRRGLLMLAFVMLLPLPKNSEAAEWQDWWQTKDQQAQQAYNHGDYDKAAKLFEDPAWQAAALYKANKQDIKQLKTPSTGTGFYNQGNVLAKVGKLEEAIKAYQQALKLEPNNQDAEYNKKLVEEALKKQQQQQQADKNKSDQKQQNQQADNKKQTQNSQDSQNSQQKQDAKNQPNKSQNQDNKQAEQQTAQAKKPTDKAEKPIQQAQMQAAETEKNERNQANEQWLNRIPDDPAGLLRRKFKYQYSQRQQ